MSDESPVGITPASVIEQANGLKAEQKALTTRINANRKLARLLVDNGLASVEEAEVIRKLYPDPKPRTRGASDSMPPPDDTTGEQGATRDPEPTADETPAPAPAPEPEAPASKPAAKRAPKQD